MIKDERESKIPWREKTPDYSHNGTDYEIHPIDETTLDDPDFVEEYSAPSTSRRTSGAVKLNKGLDKNPE